MCRSASHAHEMDKLREITITAVVKWIDLVACDKPLVENRDPIWTSTVVDAKARVLRGARWSAASRRRDAAW
jgi:hypothetical protein